LTLQVCGFQKHSQRVRELCRRTGFNGEANIPTNHCQLEGSGLPPPPAMVRCMVRNLNLDDTNQAYLLLQPGLFIAPTRPSNQLVSYHLVLQLLPVFNLQPYSKVHCLPSSPDLKPHLQPPTFGLTFTPRVEAPSYLKPQSLHGRAGSAAKTSLAALARPGSLEAVVETGQASPASIKRSHTNP